MTAAERFPDPVLSVRQPWAWAIIYGGKDVENRTWSTLYRGRLWIHASGREIADDVEFVTELVAKGWRGREETAPDALARAVEHYREAGTRGAIIGSVTLVDVRRYEEPVDVWAHGPFGWLLRDPRPCDPWPMPGRLGLWRVGA